MAAAILAALNWLCSAAARAGDRLAVLEFFGRPTGAYCSAAGPTMRTLQAQMEVLALLEERRPSHGRYDMLGAVEGIAPELRASTDRLRLDRAHPTGELELGGPHVLEWTATADEPWIELSPSSGTLPATLEITLVPELRPPQDDEAELRIDASGEGMRFSTAVEVTVGTPIRRVLGRHP